MDPTKKRKKIIIFILIVLGLLILMLVLTLIKNKKDPNTNEPNTKEKINVTQVLEETVYYPAITADSNIVFFAGKEQKIQKYSIKEKQIIKEYPLDIPYILSATWSDDKNLVLIKTQKQDSGETKFFSYNLSLEKIAELNQDILNPYWDKDKLIYQYFQDDSNTLNQSDWDGKNWQKISDLTSCDDLKYYNKDKSEVFCEIAKEDMLTDLAKISLDTKKVDLIYKGLFLYETIYPSSGFMMVQYNKDEKNNFELLNTATSQIIKIINNSDVDNSQKLQLNQNKLYYTLNTSPTKNDDIYIFDTQTNSTEKINFCSANAIDPQNIMFDSSDSSIYFLSDQILYKLETKK